MKLKIDKLKELLDQIHELPNYREFYDTLKERGILYCYCFSDVYIRIFDHLDDAFYRAQTIIDNILPYYLNNICNKTFEKLYNFQPYDSIEDGESGLYLGIPFFKLPHADMVYDRWHAHEHERLKNDFENDTEHLTEYLMNSKFDLKDQTQRLYEAEVKFKTASSPVCRSGWACDINKYCLLYT